MADSMIFYSSFKSAIDKISDPQDALAAYEAIIGYALTGEVPETDGVVSIVFDMAKPQIDANKKRREDGKKGGRPKKTTGKKSRVSANEKPMVYENENHTFSNEKPNVNVNANVNVNDNDNVKDSGARSRFIPPTVEEVRSYCQERKNNVDPEIFVAYYSSQRWKKANGQPVSDWKGCVRTWEKKDDRQQEARSGTPPNAKIHNFPERQYDYSALEQVLTQN